jgi:hypothetical protein
LILQVRPGLGGDFHVSSDVTSVQFSEPLSDGDFKRLAAALEGRQDVSLRAYDATAHGLSNVDFLSYFPNIRKLSIELWALTNLDGFQAVHELDELTFGWTATKKHSLSFLAKFASLRRLHLEQHRKDIEVVAGLPNIEELLLRSITLPDVKLLARLPKLRRLEIKLGGTSNLQDLGALTQLEYLELWLIRGLRDTSFFSGLVSLRALFLQALKHVTSLPSLRGLPKLRGVYLETMPGITDLQPIADAPSLERLFLVDMPKLTVEAFHCLVGHPSLQEFSAGLGSVRRNAEVTALVGVPSHSTWIEHTRP